MSLPVTRMGSADGNKTQEHIGGIWDFWIIKVDGQGNKVWDVTLGVPKTMNGRSLMQWTKVSWLSVPPTPMFWGCFDG